MIFCEPLGVYLGTGLHGGSAVCFWSKFNPFSPEAAIIDMAVTFPTLERAQEEIRTWRPQTLADLAQHLTLVRVQPDRRVHGLSLPFASVQACRDAGIEPWLAVNDAAHTGVDGEAASLWLN